MALEDMCFAAASVMAAAPRTRWAQNFQAPPTPVWAWLRPAGIAGDRPARLTVTNWWGEALQGRVTLTCTPGGLLLQYPSSVPNPPLEITLSEPGWVDFGRGVIPGDVADDLGTALIDTRRIITFSAPLGQPLDPEERRVTRRSAAFRRARLLAGRLDVSWRVLAPHVGMLKPQHNLHALDETSPGPGAALQALITRQDGTPQRQALLSGAQLRALREGRGMSREDVAGQVSGLLPGHPLSTHALEMLEKTGHLPATAGLIAALDHIYRCDGHLGIDHVFDSRTAHPLPGKPYTVAFPAFYTGPVWIQAIAPDSTGAGSIDLTWAAWRRRQLVRSGTLVTTRKSLPDAKPLIITGPPGWRILAGIGSAPTAQDISHGWHPVSIRAALAMLRDGVDAIIMSQQSFQPDGIIQATGAEEHHDG
jgi:hypothetical protein